MIIGEEGTGARLSSCVIQSPAKADDCRNDLPPPKLLTTAPASP